MASCAFDVVLADTMVLGGAIDRRICLGTGTYIDVCFMDSDAAYRIRCHNVVCARAPHSIS